MASEIRREQLLGNFRPTVRERNQKQPSAASKRPGMSPEHLALVRQLPCCVSGKPAPNDPHHLKAGLSHERGTGRKATDRWVVPLSRFKHDELERLGTHRETAWFQQHGIDDPLELANALWQATGDLARMRRVLASHTGLG